MKTLDLERCSKTVQGWRLGSMQNGMGECSIGPSCVGRAYGDDNDVGKAASER